MYTLNAFKTFNLISSEKNCKQSRLICQNCVTLSFLIFQKNSIDFIVNDQTKTSQPLKLVFR